MNLNSEIQFYAELRLVDKARLLNLFLHELAEEARGTYGPGTEQVHDGAHLRFVNELYHRLTRVIEQLLAEHEPMPDYIPDPDADPDEDAQARQTDDESGGAEERE